VLITYVDSDLFVTFHNQAYERWFGKQFPTTAMLHINDVYGNENAKPIADKLPDLLKGEVQYFDSVFTLSQNRTCDVAITAIPHMGDYQQVHGVFLLITDSTVQKDAERKLQHAKEEAEHSAQLKADFLANVSHELRTPMNGVIGASELVLTTNLSEEQSEYISIIQSSAKSLLRLINDILDFSKLESENLRILTRTFEIRHIFFRTLDLLKVSAKEKKIVFESTVADDIPEYLIGDPDRVRQVLLNVVGNAVKFTPPKGKITASMTLEKLSGDTVTLLFTVRDSGIGISDDLLEEIFQPFVQEDTSSTRKFGGTGLGLAIASQLVQEFGGKIWAESKAGEGSSFYFTIPFGRDKSEQLVNNTCQPLPDDDFSSLASRKLKVLLVEDNRVNQKVASRILRKYGINVILAENGIEAVNLSTATVFDVILMDCQMPIMDGFEATKKIREHDAAHGKHTPVIALTAHALDGDEERCINSGMDAYIAKPLKPTKLLSTINRIAKTIKQND
jgi:signal transduction histidine kinase/CheY-like chemotaxis protein